MRSPSEKQFPIISTRLRYWIVRSLFLGFAAITSSGDAQTNSWTNSASGKWEDVSKWSLGVAPTNTQSIFITNAASKTVTIDELTPLESKTVSNLLVFSDLPATNRLSIVNARATGTLRVLNSCVLSNGGQMSITNSDIQVGSRSGGYIRADGVISLLGDSSFVSTNYAISIAQSASGTLTVDGGDLKSGPIYLGRSTGMVGTLRISAGTVSVSDGGLPASVILGIGRELGATGVVWMTGGQLTALNNSVTSGVIAVSLGGVGEMKVSNGTVICENIWVGWSVFSQEGTLSIAGGTVSVLETLSVSARSNYSGQVWMTGGSVTTSNLYINGDGRAEMVISNGVFSTLTARIGRVIGSYKRRGALAIAGGRMTASHLIVGDGACLATGTVTLTSGTLFVTNVVHDATLDIRTGTLTMNGGTLLADRLVITNSCARLIHTAGSISIGTMILDPTLDADGDGLLNSWEQINGLDPLTPTGINGPAGDPDGDGLSNLQELLAGTSPTKATSALRITGTEAVGDDILVSWTTAGGRTNVVEATSDLADSYTNLIPHIIVPGSGDVTTNYLDVGGATNVPARFYRIRLVP